MDKNCCRKISLAKGELHVYDFGAVKLHAYRTNDYLEDEVFVLEKAGRAVILESPCFMDNIAEFTDYLVAERLHVEGILLSYHLAGGTLLPNVRKYATRRAEEYGLNGGGAGLISNFKASFGAEFDATVHKITDYLQAGETEIVGIQLVIVPTEEAYDVIVPEINAVYTHMLGHDCHSIVAGTSHADAMIAQLKGYLSERYDLVLTSHYTPEDLKDVSAKIEYLEQLKGLAAECESAEELKARVRTQYPSYSGDNYLEMTANMFFPE